MSGPTSCPTPFKEQLKGSAAARALLKLLGWTVKFEGIPARQGVIVAYPHTSNWDFPVLVLAKWAVGLQVRFWGKDSLFQIPVFGAWLRWLGGVPVVRGTSKGVVGDMVQTMSNARDRNEVFWLALAPEGTRSLTQGWRSGFYQVAVKAQVPLGIACLDVRRKHVEVTRFFMLSGNAEQDMPVIQQALEQAYGFNPLQASPIRLLQK